MQRNQGLVFLNCLPTAWAAPCVLRPSSALGAGAEACSHRLLQLSALALWGSRQATGPTETARQLLRFCWISALPLPLSATRT
ncbi:hypothetical protein PoB_007454400 [Plakobranchus ocellatus]|uniref:Secreted protein n=1 Tax=Plakobranchus ocellatus TaxID=259542 RepID=A0AAV4DUX1_9GAST|nr:hypothetical protein PoB_007454400 [Plakobranchus ocellatus]